MGMEDIFQKRYTKLKPKLLDDRSINPSNRKLFKKFLEEHEVKLKRTRGLQQNDEGNYKTLYSYIRMLKTVNIWFNNKDWKQLNKKDIMDVHNGLEDGKIVNQRGKPFENLNDSYYSKVLKSRPFELAGKLELARSVIKYTKPNNDDEVRYITEEDFRKLANNAYKPAHRLLFWLAWDIGENINSLLRLKKSDFYRQKNPYTHEDEYRVNLRKEILKRTRKPRSEITNFNETVELLDQHISDLKSDDLLFNFDYRNAKKIIDRAVERSKIKCSPQGQKPSWKDLRSGMACDLLSKHWTTDEVNSRLGHAPSSDEINKYINFLAIDRHRPKQKVQQFELQKINDELLQSKNREKVMSRKVEQLQNDYDDLIQKLTLFTKKLKIKD
jgi:hypothetical protein